MRLARWIAVPLLACACGLGLTGDPDAGVKPEAAPSAEAQAWLDEKTVSIATGTHVDPRRSKVTVGEWSGQWMAGRVHDYPEQIAAGFEGEKEPLTLTAPSQYVTRVDSRVTSS